jgi:hypothetical protein
MLFRIYICKKKFQKKSLPTNYLGQDPDTDKSQIRIRTKLLLNVHKKSSYGRPVIFLKIYVIVESIPEYQVINSI